MKNQLSDTSPDHIQGTNIVRLGEYPSRWNRFRSRPDRTEEKFVLAGRIQPRDQIFIAADILPV